MGYSDEKSSAYSETLGIQPDDIGPLMQAVHNLHKNVEHLHLQMDRMEIKFRPVLRSVPDKPTDGQVTPRTPRAEITERLEDVGLGLERIGTRIGDMLTRCEL